MKSKLVILDTNLWISFLITKDFGFLDKYISTKKAKLVFSEELIQEFVEVVTRPRFQKYFKETDIEHLLHIFDNFGIMIKVTSKIEQCRDHKDNFLLNLAVDSKADYLVTGDKDLLEIEKIITTDIVTIRQLMDKM